MVVVSGDGEEAGGVRTGPGGAHGCGGLGLGDLPLAVEVQVAVVDAEEIADVGHVDRGAGQYLVACDSY